MKKVPPTLRLPTLVMTPPPSPVQAPLVASELSLEFASISSAKKIVVTDVFQLLKLLATVHTSERFMLEAQASERALICQ